MPFFRKSASANFDIFSGFAYYLPGLKDLIPIVCWLLVGALVGSLFSALFLIAMPSPNATAYAMIVFYPLQFLAVMLMARSKSSQASLFEKGYALDTNHFGTMSGALAALLCAIAILAMSFWTDLVTIGLPDMPESLKTAMKSLTEGPLWANLLCVGVFAPFFEEWLCRGTLLRGLLNHKRKDGTVMKPMWAIVISAAFFALIHMNPWQAIPAFIIGLMMGWVYYRTGSLKLTMLMHCVNNTSVVLLSRLPSLKEAETWMDVLPVWAYCAALALAAALLYFFVRTMLKITPLTPQGSCAELSESAI